MCKYRRWFIFLMVVALSMNTGTAYAKKTPKPKETTKAEATAKPEDKTQGATLDYSAKGNYEIPTKDGMQGKKVKKSSVHECWGTLIKEGFCEQAAAGCVGNWIQEHELKTSDADGGLGMIQWIGERRPKIKKWITSHGYEVESVIGQTEAAIHEMQEDYYFGKASSKKMLYSDLQACTDIEKVTRQVCDIYEAPGKPLIENRIYYAKWVYSTMTGADLDKLMQGIDTGGQTSTTATTGTAINFGSTNTMDEGHYIKEQKESAEGNVEFADRSDFTQSEKDNLAQLKEEDELNKFSWVRFLKTVVSYIGIVMSMYTLLMYALYWFDRVNPLFDYSLLGLATAGKFRTSYDGESTYGDKSLKQVEVNESDILKITLGYFLLGTLLMSGKIYYGVHLLRDAVLLVYSIITGVMV